MARRRVKDNKDNFIDNTKGAIGDRLNGTDQDDLIGGRSFKKSGAVADEIIKAGKGADTIRGNGGKDKIDVGRDNDKDVVVAWRSEDDPDGFITVTNFNPAHDVVSFTYVDFSRNDIDRSDVTTRQTAEGTLIESKGGGDILLVGVDEDDINPNKHFKGFKDESGDDGDDAAG